MFQALVKAYCFLFVAGTAGLSIAQFIVYGESQDYRKQCWNMREWTLASGFINIFAAFIVGAMLLGAFHGKILRAVYSCFVAGSQLTILVRALCASYLIEEECTTFWTTHMPQMITYQLVEIGYFYFSVGAVISIIVTYIVYGNPEEKKAEQDIVEMNIVLIKS